MRLKSYLLQINPVLSRPEAARRLLRIFATVLLVALHYYNRREENAK